VHGKIVGRGDIPDGHGYRWPPGDWFLVVSVGAFLGLVPKTGWLVGFGGWAVGGVAPTYRLGAKNRMVGGFCWMGRRGCHPDLRVGAGNLGNNGFGFPGSRKS